MGEEKFNASKFPEAGKILVELMTSPDFHEFLTLDAYAAIWRRLSKWCRLAAGFRLSEVPVRAQGWNYFSIC